MERTKQDRADYRSSMRSFNGKLRADKKTISQITKEINKLQKKRDKLIVDLGNVYYLCFVSSEEATKRPCDDLCAKISKVDDLLCSYKEDLSTAHAEHVRHNGMKKEYRAAWKSGSEAEFEI